jgi:uncharacterized protein (DUF1697 family)
MTTYIALLRGINVGGKHIIKMEALKTLLINIGLQNVVTYIQSGNIVFKATKTNKVALAKKISEAITAQYKFNVPVLVIDATELNQIVSNNPLHTPQNEAFLHVTLLNDTPSVTNIATIPVNNFLPNQFTIVDKAIYLLCPEGYNKCKVTNNYIEKKLLTTSTTRNWKTLLTLLEMSGG